jgi:hypothetical protein
MQSTTWDMSRESSWLSNISGKWIYYRRIVSIKYKQSMETDKETNKGKEAKKV